MDEPTLTCIQCGCKITEGHYNTPDGRYCTKCWSKVPKSRKQEMEQEIIRKWSTPPLPL